MDRTQVTDIIIECASQTQRQDLSGWARAMYLHSVHNQGAKFPAPVTRLRNSMITLYTRQELRPGDSILK